MKNRLAIIGVGELGQQVANLALSCGYNVVGFFDDFIPKEQNNTILGKTDEVFPFYKANAFDCLFIGIGYQHMDARKSFYEKYENKIPFATIIHKSVIIDDSAKLGQGVIVYPGCVIDKNVIIGNNVLLHIAVVVAHDSHVSNHCFISARVSIAGFSSVGQCCMLGINSTIIDNLNIVDNVTIGAGSVVIKNIDKKGLYVGSPTRFIRNV